VAERCVINPELPPASKSWLRPATIVKLRSGTAVRVGKLAATIASSAAAITSPTRLIASQLLIQSYHGQEDSAFGDIRQTSSSVPCTQRPVQHQKKCDGEDRPSPAPRLVQHHAFVPLRGAELPQARPNTTRRPRLSGNSPRPSDGPGPRSCRRGPGYQMTMKEWGGRRAWPHGRNVLQFQLMTNSQFHLLFKDRVESGGENQPQTDLGSLPFIARRVVTGRGRETNPEVTGPCSHAPSRRSALAWRTAALPVLSQAF
jgi:hypothetical protein